MAISQYVLSNGKVRYKATVWKKGQQLRSKSFSRKMDGVDWERRQQLEVQNAATGLLKSDTITFTEFFEEVYWPNRRIRESTEVDYRTIYEKYLKPQFGNSRLIEIKEDEWALHFKRLLDEGLSKGRVNRIHATASAVYSLGCKWRYTLYNPLKLVEWYREELRELPCWTQEDANKFLTWAKNTENPRFALYLTAYETGMRISELIALQRDCLDFGAGLIEIRRTWSKHIRKVQSSTKSGQKRHIGMNPDLKVILRRVLRSHQSAFIFPGPSGDTLRYEIACRHFKRDQELAEVKRIGLHGIRRTHATHFMMNGGNIFDLKGLLGHATVETTMDYVKYAPTHLKSQSHRVQFQENLGAANVIRFQTHCHGTAMTGSDGKNGKT